MCKDCENDYEALAKNCAENLAELEAKNEALESALSESLKCYRKLSDENVQLVITNTHLMKKAYYDHRT